MNPFILGKFDTDIKMISPTTPEKKIQGICLISFKCLEKTAAINALVILR